LSIIPLFCKGKLGWKKFVKDILLLFIHFSFKNMGCKLSKSNNKH